MYRDSNPAKTQFGTQTHVAGTRTQPKPCLELEPTRLGLEPSQNLVWDLNPAKTQFGTQIHMAVTQTQPEPCLGLEPTWLGLSSVQLLSHV